MPTGEIHVEAFGDNVNEIEANAKRLQDSSKDDDLVFKIPFSKALVYIVLKILKRLDFGRIYT